MAKLDLSCEECGTSGAKRCYKLNPRNFKKTCKMLCGRCRERLGWALDQGRTKAP